MVIEPLGRLLFQFSTLFRFLDLWDVYVGATTRGTISWLYFALVNPFVSTLQTYPFWQGVSPYYFQRFGICLLKHLNIFYHCCHSNSNTKRAMPQNLKFDVIYFVPRRLSRFVLSAGLTSTFFGMKDNFLPQVGHLPS